MLRESHFCFGGIFYNFTVTLHSDIRDAVDLKLPRQWWPTADQSERS